MNVRSVFLILGFVWLVPVTGMAQGPWGYFRIPDLTQDQKVRMDALWMAWMRETMATSAALQQATVDLRIQLSGENPDATALRQAMERVMSYKGRMLEADVQFVLDVKKVLRPDQLRWFNLDLLSRSRYSEPLVDPDIPMTSDSGPKGPNERTGPGGSGPGAPSSQGPSMGPQGPGGPAGWCGPGRDDENDETQSSPPKRKGRK